MAWRKFFKKREADSSHRLFLVFFSEDQHYLVVASNSLEAEKIVNTEIFHNQTIPGFPKTEVLSKAELKKRIGIIAKGKLKKKGIFNLD